MNVKSFCAFAATIALVACPEPPLEPASPALPDVPRSPDGGLDGEISPDVPSTLPPLDLSTPLAAGEARAGVIDKSSDLLTGPKADGRIGDVKMYNAKAAFIIEGVRRVDGYRYYGGNAVDMSALNADGSQSTQDVFGELAHSWNLMAFEAQSVEVVDDGRVSGTAHVRISGQASNLAFADSFIRSFLNPDPLTVDISYDYFLGPDEPYLRHDVTIINVGTEPAEISPPVLLSNQGDGLFHFRRRDGFSTSGGPVDYIAMTGARSAVGLMTSDTTLEFAFDYSNVLICLEQDFSVPIGESHTRSYYFAVSDAGQNGLDAIAADLGMTTAKDATIEGTVSLPATASPAEAIVAVWDGGEPMTMRPLNSDGTYALGVGEGDYRVEVYVPKHGSPTPVEVSALSGQSVTADFVVEAAATITASVVDSSGDPVDARVMFVVDPADSATASPYPPESFDVRGDGSWSWSDGGYGRVSAVGYAIGGETTQIVPAGTYTLQATRGFNYTIDSAQVSVAAGDTGSVTLTIDKVVDSTGWVSGDFHIHALRSPDSNVPWDVRVLQAVTVEMEAPPLTEHVTLASLGPAIEELDVGARIIEVPGQEVTTFEFGHFNSFPLEYRDDEPNNGAVFPYDKTPAALFEAIRSQGKWEPFVQVNHPRGTAIGGYFDYIGFDNTTGQSQRTGDSYSTNFDGVEVFNGSCGVGEEFDDWVAMTNMGWRKALSSGSDSHKERGIVGTPRQVVNIAQAEVRADLGAYAEAIRRRRSFVTCGPFVRFETVDLTASLGDMATVDSGGEVAFRVQVSAPSWQALTEARILRNGEVIDVLPITEVASGVRLDATVTDTPEADAWYMVWVTGTGDVLPVYNSGAPAAFTNPIEVDADGDEQWTAPGLPAAEP